jgi:SAM-dependent methyltransferase
MLLKMSPADQSLTPNNISLILDRLACPQCQTAVEWQNGLLLCRSCGTSYPVINGVPDLRLPAPHQKVELVAWSKHWSESNQASLFQKLFSIFRRAVTARAIRYFLDCYFPYSGIFVEAGSGTSETSVRIEKNNHSRLLVAVDIVLPVVSICDPIMDVKVCGDIFHLPFQGNSIDGIWNVGVMEHFTSNQIDQILREFHRVLRHESPVILLWPGTDSTPQRMLRLVEKIINLKKKGPKFLFHPEEISQLSSMKEGHDFLERNGFAVLHIDYGFRNLLAFKTLIGAKK